jgi:predicted nucleic acid-binding Zn ribbon protein
MNPGRCLWCGDPLGIESRADRRTCSDLCRKLLSLRKAAQQAAPRAYRARQAKIAPASGGRPTSGPSREDRGSQP